VRALDTQSGEACNVRVKTLPVLLAIGLLALPLTAQNSPQKDDDMSDRERSGLRGPVKAIAEEDTHDILNPKTGAPSERRFFSTTEFDRDGHTLLARFRNPDGSEWITRKEYSASGLLLKTAAGQDGNL